MNQVRMTLLLIATLGIALITCPAQSTTAFQDPQHSCKSVVKLKISAASIGLPTNGATVNSAKLIHDERGEYCKVLGRISPVDALAQPIRFEVNLPTHWNRKAVHFGGGLFDGWLGATNGLKHLPVSIANQPGPLERGYVTFGGDSGHHKHYLLLPDELNAVNASFAKNLEERRNFAQDGLKKTHDAAMAIIEQRYGSRPDRMFFLGGSTGGREAYFVVQRWPDDYDGVLGAYAGWDQVQLDLQLIRVSQAMYAKGGFLPKSATKLLSQSVMQQCDALDGAKDGIIANVAACHFDPATLLCAAGQNGKHCLTSQQLATVQTFATEQKTVQPLWHGVQEMPGYNVLAGSDLTGSMGIFHHPQRTPIIFLNSLYYVVGDQVLRYFVTGDDHYNALKFNTTTGGDYAAELLPQSQASDASDSDLSRFAQHGGKFLMLHGTTDATIPTGASVLYFDMLERTMGKDAVDKFARFYLVPGYGHGRGDFDAGFDALGTLDHWLDTGTAPANLVVVDNNRNSASRTRPLCQYPTWPKYNGSGNLNSATSFACATQ